MNTPECPYEKHSPSEHKEIYPYQVKVLFSGHEVMGQGWICEQCAMSFFIVKSFNEKKKIKFKGTRSKEIK